jgi:hypothetical protein
VIITTEQLKQIAGAGGGLVLDAASLTFSQLKDIGTAARTGNAQITVRNCSGLTAVQLIELSASAPGLIAFDCAT